MAKSPGIALRDSAMLGNRASSTFSLREITLTSPWFFTARQRYPSNLISNVQFPLLGNAVTGLHCINSTKRGATLFEVEGRLLVVSSPHLLDKRGCPIQGRNRWRRGNARDVF